VSSLVRRVAEADRFWARVWRAGAAGGHCWVWCGAVAVGTGYGLFRRSDGVLVGAHCYAWELAHPGESRAGFCVRHACDNPPCVNPAHLLIGTHADNVADMDARGRRVRSAPRGEDHPAAKLTADAVIAARYAHSRGAKVGFLARLYGVSPATMASAIAGKTWV
jgi:HNH endonuclease